MKSLRFIALVCLFIASACAPIAPQGDLPVVETGVDSTSWALVPAGSFLYGLHEHPVDLPAYEIMVTNVTNQQFADFLNQATTDGTLTLKDAGIFTFYHGDPFMGVKHEEEIAAGDWLVFAPTAEGVRVIQNEQGAYESLPNYANHPATMVTWFGANAYCEYYGDRLPTEQEWEKAARGTDNRPYPWGSGILRNQANYYSSHDLFEKIVGGLGDTTPVGFYNGKTYDGYETVDQASPYGLYDMAGNVWQWTSNITEGIHYRYMRGGSKADYAYNLRVWSRNSATPTYASPSVGFRCVRDPEN